MKAVIFTGSRKYNNTRLVASKVIKYSYNNIIIHGACPTGLDKIVDTFGRLLNRAIISMPAQWNIHNKMVGPIRNDDMINVLLSLGNCGYDICVEGFPLPDSKGTYNMIKKS